MKIDTLELTNFRSAESLDIKFNDRLNVLVGVNGAGKTTILESIAILLSWLVSRIQNASGRGNYIKNTDVRYNSPNSVLKLTVSESNRKFQWNLAKTAKGYDRFLKSDLGSSSDLASLYREQLRDGNNLPVIAYYPVSRTVANISPEPNFDVDNYLFEIYENCLSGGSNYTSFFEWFYIQNNILNARYKKEIENPVIKYKKEISNIIGFFNILSLNEDNFFKKRPFYKNRLDHDDLSDFPFDYIIHILIMSLQEIEFAEANTTISDLECMVSLLIDLLDNMMYLNVSKSKEHNNYNKYYKTLLNFCMTYKSLILEFGNNQTLNYFWKVFISFNKLFLWNVNVKSKKGILNKLQQFEKNILDEDYTDNLFKNFTDDVQKIIVQDAEKQKIIIKNNGKELKAVANAIEKFIPEYKNLRMEVEPRPHILIDKENREFNLEHLSDGEKNLITLVGDIARRLAIANPKMKNPLEGDGIVLIDELDLHLHPKWQRLMIPRLQATFPNCQFIVTTHSPQVLSHVKAESIKLLKNENNTLYTLPIIESYGKNTDRILEDILDVDSRPTYIKEDLRELYRTIDKGEFELAESEIERISSIIEGSEPELSKARVLIRRKRLIGK